MPFWIVPVNALVDLPKVEMVSLQTRERILQHLHGDLGVAPVRTDLRHQERLIAAVVGLERLAHAFL